MGKSIARVDERTSMGDHFVIIGVCRSLQLLVVTGNYWGSVIGPVSIGGHIAIIGGQRVNIYILGSILL